MDVCPSALYLSVALDLFDAFPARFGRLAHLDGSPVGVPRPEATAREFAAYALLTSLLKKFEAAADAERLKRECEESFLAANAACYEPLPFLSGISTEVEAVAVGEALQLLGNLGLHYDPTADCAVSRFTWESISRSMDVGPGAARGARGTDLYRKVADSPLTCSTEFVGRLYLEAVEVRGGAYFEAEMLRRKRYGLPRIVPQSKFDTAAKNREKRRSTCTEPSCNMMLQKGLGSCMEDELAGSFGIRLESQPDRNRALAYRGSVDGKISTIDLKDASNTIRLSLNNHLEPTLAGWVRVLRTSAVELPQGGVQELYMISTMGNGFTFALQTLIFSCIVKACFRVSGLPWMRADAANASWGVFGDDIVVPTEMYGIVCRLLSLFGFTVNAEKSFDQGLFRESCGHDYYDGQNVRGVYIRKLRTQQDKCSAYNRLRRWSVNWNVPMDRSLSLLLVGTKKFFVPPWESDDAGLKVPESLAKVKWVENDSIRLATYRKWASDPLAIPVDDPEVWQGKTSLARTLKIRENPSGIFLAASAGALRNGRITPRSYGDPKYKIVHALAHCWDQQELWSLSVVNNRLVQIREPLSEYVSTVKFTAEGWLRFQAAESLTG